MIYLLLRRGLDEKKVLDVQHEEKRNTNVSTDAGIALLTEYIKTNKTQLSDVLIMFNNRDGTIHQLVI